QFGHL
ncbi:hypothetical protein D043_4852B, partial [Vibrio parahaemolyticus EKP-021]